VQSPRDDVSLVAHRNSDDIGLVAPTNSAAPPTSAEELALEAVAANGWRPAETGRIGGWVLRANGGFTGRANSILPLRSPGLPLDEAIDAARAWYAARGLPLAFQVPTESRRLLDAELGERGWDFSTDVHVMTRPVDGLGLDTGAGRPTRPPVSITTEPDEDWYARYRDGAGACPQARALLTRHDRAGFASIRDTEGRVIAIGRGTLDEDADGGRWLGVFAVEVEPARRRRGLARAIMAALHEWGAAQGAARAYLQVEATNDAAVRLYEQLGYGVHHDYRYRRDPDDEGAISGC